MVKKNDDPKSGIYRDFGDEIAHALSLYERKKNECPKGVVGLVHKVVTDTVSTKHYLLLRFVDPATGKRKMTACGENFTEEGIIAAVAKAHKIAAALKTITPNEFWSWYDREILNKSEKVELLTYRQIFADIEDEYYSKKNRNVKRRRTDDRNKPGGVNDISTFNAQYGKVFKKFPNWDTIPTWDEMKAVWFTWERGTKSFAMVKTTIRAICKRLPNSDELMKRIDKVRAIQTDFKEKQRIGLDEYLVWYESAWESMLAMKHPIHREGRANWLWASAMAVMYGFRPSEIAAILNLTETYTTASGKRVYPLTDTERNPKGLVVIGEFTPNGVSTKTGSRPISPVPDKELMERLRIREVHKLTYTPKPGSKPEVIADGFEKNFRKCIIAMKCPVSDLYAFRHLYNFLCELHGVPPQVRADNMGHGERVNIGDYRDRQNEDDKLAKLENLKHPLPYDRAIAKLEELGVDTSLPDVKLILRVIYQLD